MARNYANIATAIWRDDDFKRNSLGAQRLYLLLISQAEISAVGALPLTVRRWAATARGYTVEQVMADLSELQDGRYVVVDEDTEEILVRSFTRWDGGYANSKRRPVVIRDAQAVASQAIRWVIRQEFERLGLPIDGLPDAPPDTPSDHPPDTPSDRASASDGVVVVTLEGYGLQPATQKPQPATRNTSEPPADATQRPDAERLCAHLADRIAANGSKRPVVTKRWREAARLMLDGDGRTEAQIRCASDWCQDDEFWRANVMSMPKLREKFDQLRLAAQRGRASPNRIATPGNPYLNDLRANGTIPALEAQ